jgi:hypothetical protein
MKFLYFDPGLGAMIVQALVAVVAGILLFTKNLLYKIKIILGFKSKDDEYDSIDIDNNNIEPDDEKE